MGLKPPSRRLHPVTHSEPLAQGVFKPVYTGASGTNRWYSPTFYSYSRVCYWIHTRCHVNTCSQSSVPDDEGNHADREHTHSGLTVRNA